MVEFQERPDNPCEVTCNFYLAMVKPSSIEDNPDDDSVETDIPKTYLKVGICFYFLQINYLVFLRLCH